MEKNDFYYQLNASAKRGAACEAAGAPPLKPFEKKHIKLYYVFSSNEYNSAVL